MHNNQVHFNGLLLVSDMDGTLLNRNKQLSVGNEQAIRYFVENGGQFTLATGRVESSVIHYLNQLPPIGPAILYNGGVIYDFQHNHICWERTLPESARSFVANVCQHFPQLGVEVYEGGAVHIVQRNAETDAHYDKEHFNRCFTNLNDVSTGWHKVIFADHPDALQRIEDMLLASDYPFDYVRSEPQFLELVPANVSKGEALAKLRQYRNGVDRIVAVGDYLNDLQMMNEADIGIAVQNGHPEVKQAADVVCTDCENDPLAQVVEWLENGRLSV